jgi:hypothetical protein
METTMGLSPQDALAALNDVEAADARARASQSNRAGAPYSLLWGAIWMVGYCLTGVLEPRYINSAWLVLTVIGITGMVLLPKPSGAGSTGRGLTMVIINTAIFAFVAATYWVMQPTTSAQYSVFPPLILGLVYMLMGSLRRTRILWVGAAIFVLSLIGYAFLKPVLPFWLAGVGGGGLILGGLWMRQP